ncbi:MAG: MCE family protein [Desulfomicrobium escambiense]|nr:MCE family protein [Desulfomicrobium escambiense]
MRRGPGGGLPVPARRVQPLHPAPTASPSPSSTPAASSPAPTFSSPGPRSARSSPSASSAATPAQNAPVLGLELEIDKRAKELIRDDSIFNIQMESLLGGKVVEITPGTKAAKVLADAPWSAASTRPSSKTWSTGAVDLVGSASINSSINSRPRIANA